MSQFDYQQFYDRNLPHIQPPGATLFVTFRLDGSIPQTVLEAWLREKRQLEAERLRREASVGAPLAPAVVADEKLTFQRRWFGKFEAALHAEMTSPAWLKDERVAAIVREALLHRDGQVYRLDAFSIMPNHVHTVFAPLLTEELAQKLAERAQISAKRRKQPPQAVPMSDDDEASVLAVIMQSLKGYTARKCNLALGRSGAFWQHESFDHVIRDQPELGRIINYVLNNPVKAGLVKEWQEWKWNYCRPSLFEDGSISAQL